MDLSTLHKISYGLFIISSKNKERINGQIANVVFQVSSEPPTIATCINKQNLTHDFIIKSNVFSVSILHEKAPLKFIGTFGFKSGRDIDKYQNVSYTFGKTKTPLIQEYTTGVIETNVKQKIDVGTHTLFIGEVINAETYNNEPLLTYENYHKVKGGYSPKTAPTFYKRMDKPKNNKKEVKKMDKYVCDVCGYVYDPEAGDPDNDIKPGTAFEDLPDDWVCPLCGAPKSEFSKEE